MCLLQTPELYCGERRGRNMGAKAPCFLMETVEIVQVVQNLPGCRRSAWLLLALQLQSAVLLGHCGARQVLKQKISKGRKKLRV